MLFLQCEPQFFEEYVFVHLFQYVCVHIIQDQLMTFAGTNDNCAVGEQKFYL